MLAIAMFAFSASAALCLAMERHFSDLLGRKPTARQLKCLRGAGWGLLLIALAVAVRNSGWAMGLVEWFAMWMAGLCLWVFALPYRPRWLLGLASAGLVLAPLSALGLF